MWHTADGTSVCCFYPRHRLGMRGIQRCFARYCTQRVGVPHALAGALRTPNLSNVSLRHCHCARPQTHQRFGTAGPTVFQGLSEDPGATQATSVPTSRHTRARARTGASAERIATPTAACQRIGGGGPSSGPLEDRSVRKVSEQMGPHSGPRQIEAPHQSRPCQRFSTEGPGSYSVGFFAMPCVNRVST